MFVEALMPRFSETDALGHINNTALPVWFEAARTPIFRFFTPDLNPEKWKLIIVKIEVEFKAELFYGQELEIHTWIDRIGGASFAIKQQVWQNQQLGAEGICTMVRFDHINKQAVPLTEHERSALEAHLK